MKKNLSEQQWLDLQKKADIFNQKLKEMYPSASMMLTYGNNWELMVAVILSAQCTDKKVNEVTPGLFVKYPTLDDYVNANPEEFEQDIKSTGFYRNKTKNILAAAKLLKEKFGGEIPKKMEDMLEIPGVARKTANIVLGNAYGIVDGIAVDTHVLQFAKVYGFSDEANSDKVEQDLMKLFPKEDWFTLTYRIIEHGREYRPGRKQGKESPLDALV